MATVKTYQEGDDKRKQAYDYFISKGYSPQVAAGIVGNLVHESGLNTSIEGDIGYKGGSSFGVAQWRGERLKKLKERYGEKWTNFDNQLEFVDWELKNTHKNAGEKLANANDIHEAGQIFSDFYEIPKKKYHENEARRLAVERVGVDFLENGYIPNDNINTEQTNFDNKNTFTNFKYRQTPHTRIGAGLPNIEETEEKNTSKKEENTSKEKEALLQKQREHQFLQDYLSGSIEQPQQEQQIQRPEIPQLDPLQEYAEISSFVENPIMQQGGKIPVSKNGVFDSNEKPVIVPSNQITMSGVDYPILGISQETGERKIMLPNVENYFFKNTQNVLEIPMMQEGGKTSEELKVILDKAKKTREENETPSSVKQGMYLDEQSKYYKQLKEKERYFNPEKIKNITSEDKLVDFIYNNDWILDAPIIGDKIKEKAKNVMESTFINNDVVGNVNNFIEKNKKFKSTFTGGSSLGEKFNSDLNLTELYFGNDKNIVKSHYKPSSDYLEFLPSYSIKRNLDEIYKEIPKENESNMKEFINYKLNNSINLLLEENKDFFKNKKTIYKQTNDQDDSRPLIKLLGINLGGYKEGMAWDEDINLPYISISDAWDFEPKHYAKKYGNIDNKNYQRNYIQASLMHKAGNPFKIYDRFYFDPKTREYISDEEIKKLKNEKG